MEIKLKEIAIRDLVAGYENDNEEGVRAFGGNLDIRPPYQREFVYSAEEQMAVIRTVAKGFPLNVMYWAQRDIVGNASGVATTITIHPTMVRSEAYPTTKSSTGSSAPYQYANILTAISR